jgi:histone-lysine N-methyltransferase SETMAR
VIEWVPKGQMVNRKYYLEVLTKLWERVRKKRQELWKKKSWILHRGSAPAHNTLIAKQFLADKFIPSLEHPPYSPDLAPCDFTCCPKWKVRWKELIFCLLMRQNRKRRTWWTGWSADDLQHCFEQWKIRMQRCIDGGGSMLKGIEINL